MHHPTAFQPAEHRVCRAGPTDCAGAEKLPLPGDTVVVVMPQCNTFLTGLCCCWCKHTCRAPRHVRLQHSYAQYTLLGNDNEWLLLVYVLTVLNFLSLFCSTLFSLTKKAAVKQHAVFTLCLDRTICSCAWFNLTFCPVICWTGL